MPVATFLTIQRLLKASLASSRVRRDHTSEPTRPRTNPSCNARIVVSIPFSSHAASYSWRATTVGGTSISSTAGMSFLAARAFAEVITLSELAREVDRRDILDDSVLWRAFRLCSSVVRFWRVACKAVFCEESGCRAEPDCAICECRELVIWCERWVRRASFSGFTGIGGAGIFDG